MTIRQIANSLENKFKNDLHISIDLVKQFIKEEIKPISFTVLDVSNEYKFRVIKTTMEIKKGKFVEYYIKPI